MVNQYRFSLLPLRGSCVIGTSHSYFAEVSQLRPHSLILDPTKFSLLL
jgi:hypothetical protein